MQWASSQCDAHANTHKKLRNYLPGFVQSLLAKHNSLSNSHRQRYNSGSNRQPTHPHKPAAMYARRLNIPHNHGKSTICCSTRPKTYGPPAVLGYLMLHGFNCAHGLTGREAQGRSASGRNGGARKTTSSNNVVMRIASNDLFLSMCKLFYRSDISWQIAAVLQLAACGPVLYPLDWAARS